MRLGNSYLLQKKFSQAQRAYETLIDLEPDNPLGYFRLGSLHQQLKQYEAALTNFEKALSLNSQLLEVFINIVRVYAAQKDFDTAMAKCDRKLKEVEGNPSAAAIIYNLKARLFLAQKKTAEAEKSFKAALRANPDYMPPYYALARMYLAEKKPDVAIGQLQAALEANPKQVGARMLLAIIFDSQKRFDQSEEQYRAILDMHPDFVPATNNLAFLLAEQDKNLDEALRLAQVAREKMPEDPNVMDTLGWVYYKKGIYDMAIVEIADALEKSPENPAIIYHLGMAYYKKGDKERAGKELQEALSVSETFDGAEEAKRILSGL